MCTDAFKEAGYCSCVDVNENLVLFLYFVNIYPVASDYSAFVCDHVCFELPLIVRYLNQLWRQYHLPSSSSDQSLSLAAASAGSGGQLVPAIWGLLGVAPSFGQNCSLHSKFVPCNRLATHVIVAAEVPAIWSLLCAAPREYESVCHAQLCITVLLYAIRIHIQTVETDINPILSVSLHINETDCRPTEISWEVASWLAVQGADNEEETMSKGSDNMIERYGNRTSSDTCNLYRLL